LAFSQLISLYQKGCWQRGFWRIEMKTWIGSPPERCDICGETLASGFVDGQTRQGPWGCLCGKCHAKYGVGLGTGRGQKYEKQGDKFVKVAG
jgi:hypothetical protein